MLLPIGHEKKTVNRLPIVTVILILTNIIAFFVTFRQVQDDRSTSNLAIVRYHILILKARYDDLVPTPEVQQMVDDFRKYRPEAWKALTAPDRPAMDTWESVLLEDENPKIEKLQVQMNELCMEFTQMQNNDDSVLWLYAYHSYHPKYRSFITHEFLHGGLLHLISNMWMLWLCGVVLEDVWGPYVVLAFYLLAGCFAAAVHGVMNPNSIIPMLGASGSVAGLMGGMLVRYPKLKIKMVFWLFIAPRTFFAPVWILAPIWFLAEVFWGIIGDRGIAHWAHVGGFAFGAVVAVAFDFSRVEKLINAPEPIDTTWKPDAEFHHAQELLNKHEVRTASAILRNYVKRFPDAFEAWVLLLEAQKLQNDIPAQRDETLPGLIRLSLAANQSDDIAFYVREFRHLGGTILPATIWLDLARHYETSEQFDLAARDFEQLGIAYYATDRASLTALMSAARLHLTKLNRPAEAKRLYLAARNSPIPHLELDAAMEHGIAQATTAIEIASRRQTAGR